MSTPSSTAHLQPRAKALAPSSSSSSSSLPGLDTSQHTTSSSPYLRTPSPREPSRPRHRVTHSASTAAADATSDRATAAFIRRTLCSQHPRVTGSSTSGDQVPIDELLPPLTSSNEVDLQLYALIAVLLREYVQTWYSRITPDTGFVDEVVHIVAHCTRALEERSRHVDMSTLLLYDIPALFDAHVRSIRLAQQAEGTVDGSRVYHTLRPHPALSPTVEVGHDSAAIAEQQANDAAYRLLLAQGVLAVLLPSEDLANPCLFALVSEVFADMILGTFVSGRLCENWFIYDCIRNASEVTLARLGTKRWALDKSVDQKPQNRLTRFGLVAQQGNTGAKRKRMSISDVARALVQYVLLAVSAIRAMVAMLAAATSLPLRHVADKGVERKGASACPTNTAMLALPLWGTIALVLNVDARMPWLGGLGSLLQWFALCGPGQIGGVKSRLDRLLAHTLFAPFADPTRTVTTVLKVARMSLFPNNALPVVPPLEAAADEARAGAQPDAAATVAAKRRAAAFAILNLLPRAAASVYFAGPASPVIASQQGRSRDDAHLEAMVAGVEDVLAIFDDQRMNRCLVYSVLERVLAGLVPELSASLGGSVRELLEEKGIGGVVAQAEIDELNM